MGKCGEKIIAKTSVQCCEILTAGLYGELLINLLNGVASCYWNSLIKCHLNLKTVVLI